jgi:hypothetical protein
MSEEEFVEMMDRLLRLACEECEKCAMGQEPEKINGFWRHGHDLCKAPLTHDRVEQLETLHSSIIIPK